MEKKTKIIIGSVVLFIAAAVGLRVFIYTEQQKDIARLNVAYNAAIQGTGQDSTVLEPLATPTPQPTTEPTPQPTATPEVEPTPQASPQVTPQAPQSPQPGDFRENNGKTETYVDGFGWLEYAPGGTQEVADFELSGNQIGQ